jgi:hypothetical protein
MPFHECDEDTEKYLRDELGATAAVCRVIRTDIRPGEKKIRFTSVSRLEELPRWEEFSTTGRHRTYEWPLEGTVLLDTPGETLVNGSEGKIESIETTFYAGTIVRRVPPKEAVPGKEEEWKPVTVRVPVACFKTRYPPEVMLPTGYSRPPFIVCRNVAGKRAVERASKELGIEIPWEKGAQREYMKALAKEELMERRKRARRRRPIEEMLERKRLWRWYPR